MTQKSHQRHESHASSRSKSSSPARTHDHRHTPAPAAPLFAEAPPVPAGMAFDQLGLAESLVRAVAAEGYTQPTPIQAQAIPQLLAGRDLLGCARTGTGKTAAFALPILHLLSLHKRRPTPGSTRVLILAPTRELAAQVAESHRVYGKHLDLVTTVIFGGVSQGAQVRAMAHGVDILVATPGRLLDLMQQRRLSLSAVEILVLDEADQMLDLGFLPDVRRVLAAVPQKRQTMLFSATMPAAIASLAASVLHDPVRVQVAPTSSTVELVEQSVHFVSRAAKPELLTRLLSDAKVERSLVFTRTKHGADRVAKRLNRDGIPAEALHGNKSQNVRERTLNAFREGKLHVLVATDIAARGIDIDNITHVFNYELPNVPETYVHRIGRTARAGASGIAVSLCDQDEKEYLRDIEALIKSKIRGVGHQDDGKRHLDEHAAAPAPRHGQTGRPGGQGRAARGGQERDHQGQDRRGASPRSQAGRAQGGQRPRPASSPSWWQKPLTATQRPDPRARPAEETRPTPFGTGL